MFAEYMYCSTHHTHKKCVYTAGAVSTFCYAEWDGCTSLLVWHFLFYSFEGTFRDCLWGCTISVHLSDWKNKYVCLLLSVWIAEHKLQLLCLVLQCFPVKLAKNHMAFYAGTLTSLIAARHWSTQAQLCASSWLSCQPRLADVPGPWS
jgi:hypothetical protein